MDHESNVTAALAAEHGLTEEEFERAVAILGRTPNMTELGGILRDVFTMGARPIAILDSLRFGNPDHPRTRHLVSGVVSGIGGYGNCVGVPTVGGECEFDAAYDGNILVNAM